MQGCREVLNSTLLSVAGRGALHRVMMRQPQHVFAMLEDSLVSARRRRVRAISDCACLVALVSASFRGP